MDHAVSASLLPPGILYFDGFLSPDEEAAVTARLDAGEWSTELKRRVQHFGYRYDYKVRAVTPEAHLGPLPPWLGLFAERLVSEGYCRNLPDQVIANEYLPGQGISAHVDCVPCFDDEIASISLLSACEMVFRDLRGPAVCGVLLYPRSGVLLRDSGRYGWTHEIPARKSDIVNGIRTARSRRISLTFRKVISSNRL
ncbi:alpha-ketoglutarate-dependent dioxygenase AlkB [Agrobacterium sp. ICMP 6402]|uniref:alpha-ketoglutarate-dependent dioxygenase AlkB n=1 Tax=Agrobacterium sp. ICMP 6402 TaxID=2292443 RepID=UPI0012951511|nr:alpha-ketoglutarate-dependent dioxygenase AlkB [Agrobacterium sp. ICMP 6402]MQB08296.1 alpha-ketoglutarate-dependent dioxygenase AlkB [Agrobacterium sp. ICMP 6402]